MTTIREALEELVASIQTAAEQNGGQIDSTSTVDQIDYVMVRRDDFDNLCASNDAARSALAAQPAQEPAPGYCKHCKQYTIEEPLAAQPAQESFDAWQENPYTKVLQKSIAEDYVPSAQPAQPAQEPVAKIVQNTAFQISLQTPDGNPFDMSRYVGCSLYTAQPAQALTDELVGMAILHTELTYGSFSEREKRIALSLLRNLGIGGKP